MPSESPTAEVDIREYLRHFSRQKWTVVGVFTFVLMATAVWTVRLPKIYEAEATLEYDPNPMNRLLGTGVEDVGNPVPTANYALAKEWYQTQNAIIASRGIALRVVERLGLHRDPLFMSIPSEKRATWTESDPEDAARALLDRLTVKPDKGTRMVKVVVEDTSPDRAALLSNAVVETYLNWMMEERMSSTVRAVDWLSGQLDGVSDRLRESEHSLHDFRKRNNVLSVSAADQQNVVTQTIQTFSNALTEATTQRIQVAAKLKRLEQALGDQSELIQAHSTLIAKAGSPSQIQQRYQEATIEHDRASKVYGPNHPQIVQVNAQLEAITLEARRELTALLSSIRRELGEVEDVEQGLRGAVHQAKAVGLELNLREIEYNRLERERANNEKVHALLLQRTAEANLTRMIRVSPVRLIDRATKPQLPIRPRVAMNVTGGAALGLLLGLGLALLRARMDRSINSPDDVTSIGIHLLGLVPAIEVPKTLSFGSASAPGRRQKRGERAGADSSKEMTVHTAPQSAVAECCRTIRTNLAFMATDRPLRSLVITSPSPSEGKSTVAASLAITLAKSGKRVLLVDTDMRRPRLHRAFSLSARVGITSILAGDSSIEDAVQSTIVEDLFLLPCGPIPPNPSELLHTARFASLLAELKTRFDILMFDSPPVNVVTDAAVIGPQVDGALLIAKGGKTSVDALRHAVGQLRDIGTNVLGCVINDLPVGAHGNHTGYYHGYNYTDRHDDDAPTNTTPDSTSASGQAI